MWYFEMGSSTLGERDRSREIYVFSPKQGVWVVRDCVFSAHMQEFLRLWVKVERSGRTRLWPF